MRRHKPELKTIPLDQLTRGKYQPRMHFDPEALDELASSIKSNGLIQPIVVRPCGVDHYEIVAGERRWRAAQLAQLESVNCLVNNYTDDQAAEVTAIENVNRVDLNPIEEARAYQRLVDDFEYIHDEIAAAVGKSRTKISNSLRLLKLEPRVQEYLIAKKISEGHGKVLAGVPQNLQYELASKTISRAWSVRKLEIEAKKILEDEKREKNPMDPNIKFLEKEVTDHIGCRVQIDFDEGKGQMKIDFQNLDILEGILTKMGYDKSE